VPVSLTRYGIDKAVKRATSLHNPFSRRTREGRAFARLLAALVREQGVERFEDLPPLRQMLTFRLTMVHMRLAVDDAALAAGSGASLSEHATDRHIAYLNALTRLAVALGISARAPDEADLETELRRLRRDSR